jgi:hypothetical protein
MSRVRLNVYLEAEHADRLAEVAMLKNLSKSSILAAALASFLAVDGTDRREAMLNARLDRLAHQFEKLERDQNILIETVALYVRLYLSVTASLPQSLQEGARAQGKARFEQFTVQLARHLQKGGSLVRDVHREVYPSTMAAPDEGASSSASEAMS